MPISTPQLEAFLETVAVRYGGQVLKVSKRIPKKCRKRMHTIALGYPIKRDMLAHHLAHYLHGRNADAHGKKKEALHGDGFNVWHKFTQNLVAAEFGPGEGVSL